MTSIPPEMASPTTSDARSLTERGPSSRETSSSFRPLPVLSSRPGPEASVDSTRVSKPGARSPRKRFPSWIKARYSENERYRFILEKMRGHGLHTVCEEAECPNIGECWGHGTATFLLLGDVCTRHCHFCAIDTGRPGALDPEEPEKVASVVADLELDYAVLTSVNRDDLPDQGSDAFARTIESIDRRLPSCRVEALVPDFQGRRAAIERVALSPLFVFAHNVETVPRLYPRVRPGSSYRRSLEVLRDAKAIAREKGGDVARGGKPRGELLTKSSLMLGLGETRAELLAVFADLRAHDVDILTLGQYLQPSPEQLAVFRFVPPDEFDSLRRAAEAMGFLHVVAGPLSRSSYHAWEVADEASEAAPPTSGGASRGRAAGPRPKPR